MNASPATLGLDVGGANLKAAHDDGSVAIHPFELWKRPGELAGALQQLVAALPAFERLAVTMTGELCDCFATKRDGVRHILDAVTATVRGKPVLVWRNDGAFVNPAAARSDPLPVAAANWLALATFAGRWAPVGASLLLDVGSTTTDIVPLWDGRPVPRGRIDPERLWARELLYCGARRTPVCALLGAEGAAELFATTQDVYVLLGDVPENPDDRDTADGRPATAPFAAARLARMLCADAETCTPAEITRLAETVRGRQLQWITDAMDAVSRSLPQRPETVILSGSGEFLARVATRGQAAAVTISMQERLGPAASGAACAYALAVLASERPGTGGVACPR